MNFIRTVLSLPRTILLLLLGLIGPLSLSIAIIEWIEGNNSDLLLSRTILSSLFAALFIAVKFTKFLIPSQKLETTVRTRTAAVGNTIKEAAEARAEVKEFKQFVHDRSTITPFEATVLGGSGWEQKSGQALLFSMDSNSFYLTDINARLDFPVPIDGVVDIEIGGLGAQKSSAGVMGGGFGLQGAATGIAIASAINLLTTRSSVNTLIRLSTSTSEVFLHTSAVDPGTARMQLSALFLKVINRPAQTNQID